MARVGVRCAALGSFLASAVSAQSLDSRRSDAHYAWHGTATLGAFVAAGALAEYAAPTRPGLELFPHFGPDVAVRANFSTASAGFSDQLLLADVVVPVAAQLSDGFDRRFANATLIYAEAHAMNALLTNAVKVTVRRPRPYTRSSNPLAEEFVREQRSDAYMSFFSGHASTTHTAAMSGSILYAMRTTDAYARHVMFGFEFLLAGLTSQLRVRAGRHYRSDVWTGTLVGMGIGLGVPALHGLPLSRIRATEWATGVGSTLLSIALTEAVDLSAVFDWLAPDKPTPLEPVDPEHTQATSFWLMPQAWPAGALIGGEF